MVSGIWRWNKRVCLALLGLLVIWTVPAIAQTALSPAQIAVLKRDLQKVEGQYVRQIARIAGVRETTARQALPDRARITDPVSRVISALEHELGKPLSDEQKAALRSAEAEYSAARKSAEANALKKP